MLDVAELAYSCESAPGKTAQTVIRTQLRPAFFFLFFFVSLLAVIPTQIKKKCMHLRGTMRKNTRREKAFSAREIVRPCFHVRLSHGQSRYSCVQTTVLVGTQKSFLC